MWRGRLHTSGEASTSSLAPSRMARALSFSDETKTRPVSLAWAMPKHASNRAVANTPLPSSHRSILLPSSSEFQERTLQRRHALLLAQPARFAVPQHLALVQDHHPLGALRLVDQVRGPE